MMKRETTTIVGERGAALVIALLVMLVLSGLGLVAMKATLDSSTLSSMHRLQIQAKSFSNAINQLGAMRSGRRAPSYHAELQNLAGESLRSDDPNPTDLDAADALRRRGGFLIFTSDPPTATTVTTASPYHKIGEGSSPDDDDGFLDGDSFVHAVEADNHVDYGYIVRDMMLGPRVPGFGDEFCFVLVEIGSRANLGEVDPTDGVDADDRLRRPQALGRNMQRTMIGPVECGGG